MMFKVASPTPVPDDAVQKIEPGDVRMSVYGHGDVHSVTLRFPEGIPLKLGELAEVEVVEIERTVVER